MNEETMGDEEWPEELMSIDEEGAADDAQAETCLNVLRDTSANEETRALAAMALAPGLQSCDAVVSWDDPMEREITDFSKEKYEEILDVLEKTYLDESTPKIVRRRVLETAIHSPQEWQVDAIRKAWASGDADWQVSAVFAMGFFDGFDDEVATALEDSSDDRILYEAVRAAGLTERTDLSGTLETIALDGSNEYPHETRVAAIEALSTAGTEKSFKVLEQLAANKDDEIADAAGWAMDEYRIWND